MHLLWVIPSCASIDLNEKKKKKKNINNDLAIWLSHDTFSFANFVSMNRSIALLSNNAFSYKSPKKEISSQAFEYLIKNLKIYNGVKI